MLLTEQQFQDLGRIAEEQHMKLGTLVREAIQEYHLKQAKQRRIAEAMDRLLALPVFRRRKTGTSSKKNLLGPMVSTPPP